MDYSTIRLSRAGPLATLTLNRPDALNAISQPMLEEMSHALEEVSGDTEVKALVLRGEGRAFCAGADLTYLQEAFGDDASLRSYLQRFNDVLFAIEELPVPAVALVNGYALAGGLELVLACDLVVAAEDARIGDQHVNFGLMPGGGSTQRLPRKLGKQRAMELLLTGKWLSGREAADLGLVLRAVPADRLEEELAGLLGTIADKSRDALGWIKRTVQKGRDLPLREGVALETHTFAHYVATSPHPREGIQAFRERRQPNFG